MLCKHPIHKPIYTCYFRTHPPLNMSLTCHTHITCYTHKNSRLLYMHVKSQDIIYINMHHPYARVPSVSETHVYTHTRECVHPHINILTRDLTQENSSFSVTSIIARLPTRPIYYLVMYMKVSCVHSCMLKWECSVWHRA